MTDLPSGRARRLGLALSDQPVLPGGDPGDAHIDGFCVTPWSHNNRHGANK